MSSVLQFPLITDLHSNRRMKPTQCHRIAVSNLSISLLCLVSRLLSLWFFPRVVWFFIRIAPNNHSTLPAIFPRCASREKSYEQLKVVVSQLIAKVVLTNSWWAVRAILLPFCKHNTPPIFHSSLDLDDIKDKYYNIIPSPLRIPLQITLPHNPTPFLYTTPTPTLDPYPHLPLAILLQPHYTTLPDPTNLKSQIKPSRFGILTLHCQPDLSCRTAKWYKS